MSRETLTSYRHVCDVCGFSKVTNSGLDTPPGWTTFMFGRTRHEARPLGTEKCTAGDICHGCFTRIMNEFYPKSTETPVLTHGQYNRTFKRFHKALDEAAQAYIEEREQDDQDH